MPGDIFNRVDFLMRNVRNRLMMLSDFIQKERTSPRRMPWRYAPVMWLKGFTSDSFYICQLDRNDPANYLPDIKRFKTRLINGDYSIVLNNKLLFDSVVGSKARVPKTYAFINEGVISPFLGSSPVSSVDDLVSFLKDNELLVVKPVRSGGGENVYILKFWGDGVLVNRQRKSIGEFKQFLRGLDSFIITEYARQGNYAEKIFPEVANTVRFLTMLDESGEPFIAFAVHKFGTRASFPVDNWRRGGITALVDLDNGMIGTPLSYFGSGVYKKMRVHPDTGSPIEGVEIPNWKERKKEILNLAKSLPYLKYVGWDVAVEDDGITVIEGNNYTDVNLLQAHCPLLKDGRIRNFYVRHGIID